MTKQNQSEPQLYACVQWGSVKAVFLGKVSQKMGMDLIRFIASLWEKSKESGWFYEI